MNIILLIIFRIFVDLKTGCMTVSRQRRKEGNLNPRRVLTEGTITKVKGFVSRLNPARGH